jgi:hypothetical protein
MSGVDDEITTLDELLEWCYEEYDMEPSEEAKRIGRQVADLQD